MSAVIVRTGGAATVGAGALLVGQVVWELAVGPLGEGPGESAIHTTWMFLLVVGLFGMYLRQQRAFGRFGQIATLVAVMGTVLMFGLALLEVLVPVSADVPAVRLGDVPVWMLVMFPGFALYALGLVLFAVASWRAAVLPRGAAATLVAGVLAGLTLKGVVPGAMAVLGVSWLWLGLATLRPVPGIRAAAGDAGEAMLTGTEAAGGH